MWIVAIVIKDLGCNQISCHAVPYYDYCLHVLNLMIFDILIFGYFQLNVFLMSKRKTKKWEHGKHKH